MLVFDKAYNTTKNKHILPLSEYSVPYKSLRNMNIKSIICSKLKSVEDVGNGKYLLSFQEDVLLKALLGDIHLFYIKAILQNEDANASNFVDITANWNIVSNYYAAFFYASLFLRLNFRGNFFLDIKAKKDLEQLMSVILGNAITLKSNSLYYIYEKDGEYILQITPSDGNTHEMVWKETDKLIGELIVLTRKNSDEYTLLKSLKSINGKLSNTFPSQLRNRVNYQPIYGIEYIEKNLFPIHNKESWVKEIISFDCKLSYDDNKIANLFSAYFSYIKIFSDKLICDYYDIKGRENGIICKINQCRRTRIILEDIPFIH